MLTTAELNAYLDRLDYQGDVEPTLSVFNRLHVLHLLHIPFENFDIAFDKEIVLNRASILEKIVTCNRGGFCYELNYAFSLLLQAIGFKVELLSARVFDGEKYGQPFDHLVLLVEFDSEHYIADVGFGDSFIFPLSFSESISCEGNIIYKIEPDDNEFIVFVSNDEQPWKPLFRFDLSTHDISEFEQMCVYQQTSPESHFTGRSICSLATQQGRVTLSDGKIILRKGGERTEAIISNVEDYRKILASYFRLTLPEDADIACLLAHNYSSSHTTNLSAWAECCCHDL